MVLTSAYIQIQYIYMYIIIYNMYTYKSLCWIAPVLESLIGEYVPLLISTTGRTAYSLSLRVFVCVCAVTCLRKNMEYTVCSGHCYVEQAFLVRSEDVPFKPVS